MHKNSLELNNNRANWICANAKSGLMGYQLRVDGNDSLCFLPHRPRRLGMVRWPLQHSQNPQEPLMSFLIYLAGFAILIGGIAWALITAGVPQHYVLIASVIMFGLGIVTGVARTRNKDPS